MIDRKILKELYLDGFPDDSSAFAEAFLSQIKDGNVLAYRENSKIVSVGYIIEKKAKLFGRETELPYLSALSTLKEHRGRGKIENIILSSFETLRKRGHDFVVLHPFNHEYYKRYSFENISFAKKRKITGGKIFKTRVAQKSDYSAVIDIYSRMCEKFDNRLIFSEDDLAQKFNEFCADGIDCIILSDESDFAFAFVEGDFINFYGTDDYQKFLSAECFKDCGFFDFSSPSEPYLQGRILNPESALRNYPYDKNLEIETKIRIIDDQIPDNNISVSLMVRGGNISIKRISAPCRSISIQKLTANMLCGDDFMFKKCKNFFIDKY